MLSLIKKLWVVALIGCILIVLMTLEVRIITFEVERSQRVIPSSGVITAGVLPFGVYWDPTGTKQVTSISWGTLSPGQTGNATLYVRNEGAAPIYCAVDWVASSWIPQNASQFFTLTWNFGRAPLYPQRSRKVLVQLYVKPNISGIETFSFDIVINAQDEPY